MFKPGNRAWENRKYKPVICVQCQESFEATGPSSKLCSKECRTRHLNNYMRDRRRASIDGSLESIVAGCRNRAKRRGLECDIDVEYVLDLYQKQEGLCAATGIKLESSQANTKSFSSPWTITVDRKDSTKGYTKDNIQLVCYMYNSCKNRWTHEDVLIMCEGVLLSSR